MNNTHSPGLFWSKAL